MRNIFLAAALALSFPVAAKSAAAEVQCADGSTGKAGRGACSRHGGVAKPTKAPEARAKMAPGSGSSSAERRPNPEAQQPQGGDAPAEKKGGVLGGLFGRRSANDTPRSSTREAPAAKTGKPMATCKDGTTSYSAHHSGTCSGHGGVQTWLDK